jgi:hypothetical protein
MIVAIDSERFSLDFYKIHGSEQIIQEFSDFLAGHPAYDGVMFFLQEEPTPLQIITSFYHSCLRFVTRENISKNLAYEFLICLTGSTQIQKLIGSIFKPNVSGNPYFFRILVNSGSTQKPSFKDLVFDKYSINGVELAIGSTDRLRLASIQQKLLSKLR